MSLSRNVQSINEEWLFVQDPGDIGLHKNWLNKASLPAGTTIHLPCLHPYPRSKTRDLSLTQYPHWLFHDFHISSSDVDRTHQELVFEGFPAKSTVWINGHLVTQQNASYVSFSVPVSAHLHPGNNIIAIRLASVAAGLGSVALHSMPRHHIEHVQVLPDIRRKRILVQVKSNTSSPVRLTIQETDINHMVFSHDEEKLVEFPDFTMWSPETPVTYSLQAELLSSDDSDQAEVLDSQCTTFGMREFTVKDQRFYLNNRPVHIKAMANITGDTADHFDLQTAEQLISCTKRAGFNAIVVSAIYPKALLEVADKMGVMVILDDFGLHDEHSNEMTENIEAIISPLANHPSLIAWQLISETIPDLQMVAAASEIKMALNPESLPHIVRELDPTRLFFVHHPNPAMKSMQFHCRPYRNLLEPMDAPSFIHSAPVSQESEYYLRQMGSTHRINMLDNCGYPVKLDHIRQLAAPDSPIRKIHETIFTDRNLDRVFENFNQFLKCLMQLEFDAIQYHLDALRNNPRLAGYCHRSHHWHSAAERKSIPALYHSLEELQKPVRPLIHIATSNLTPREETPLTIYLVNEKRLEGRAEMSLQLIGPTNQVLWKKRRSVKLPKPGKELWSGSIAASGSTGTHKFIVRLMQNNSLIAQNNFELYVMKPVESERIRVHLLDTIGYWTSKCKPFVEFDNLLAPVHIIPPLSNSIAGYPENELMQALAQVYGGAIALVFNPPEDWNDLAESLDPGIKASSRALLDDTEYTGHYARLHPVFEGLPSRDLMRTPYRNILPDRTFTETGDEDICGALVLNQNEASNTDTMAWWGTNILVRRYGSGRIVFIHLHILEHLGSDPVADRLFTNLLQHFERRSVPSTIPLHVYQPAVEWIRFARTQLMRRWMVVGCFSNWELQGHDTIYPPEELVDFNASYHGWNQMIEWKTWYTHTNQGHLLDFQDALGIFKQQQPMEDYVTAYAYAEFTCDRRAEVCAMLGVQNAMRIWINGRAVHAIDRHVPSGNLGMDSFTTYLRQGRNTLLVKCSKIPGPFRFTIEFESMDASPINLNWWK